jgi:hypothetical protein
MKLETINIFLDTSIFEKNNFLNSNKINSLIKHAEEKIVLLYSSEIAITEMKERIKKKIQKAKSEIKKFRNQKPKPVEIFRNTDTYESFDKIWNIDYEKEEKEICSKIDTLVSNTPIVLIPTEGVDISVIFNSYFKNKAPFKEGEKKYEFPDAFILASIDSWCKLNASKMIIVSSDNDWLNYESDFIIKFNDLDNLLKNITDHKEIADKERRLEFINRVYEENESKLENDLKVHLDDSTNINTGEADLDKFEITNFEWSDYIITDHEEEFAELKTTVKLNIKAWISYQDFDTGYYDKEDDIWHFVETVHDTFEEEIEIPVTIGISYDIDSEDYEIIFESINDDKYIDIDYDIFGYKEMYQ